jgi:hypothetical protein
MSVNGWTDEQNTIYSYSGVFFSQKKEWSSETYYNEDEVWSLILSERRKIQRVTHYMIAFIWNILKK